MKTKALLLGGLLACCALTANAQEGFRAGITAGMNVTNITDTEMDCRIGFNAGARFEYNFNPNLYLGWGVQWSMKGNMKDVEKKRCKSDGEEQRSLLGNSSKHWWSHSSKR